MATAKKLPSGNFRCRVYSHTDENGKRIYESFTATTKKEAELLATQFANRKGRRAAHDLTVSEAVSEYISAGKPRWSPATTRTYSKALDAIEKTDLARARIKRLDVSDVQKFVNDLIALGRSPRTINLYYHLIQQALCQQDENFYITLRKVKLPHPAPDDTPAMPDEFVALLLDNSKGMLKRGIALGLVSLRAGEACAVKYGDLDGDELRVHGTMVRNVNDEWEYKGSPKTAASNRTVVLPPSFVDLIGQGEPDEYILGGMNPLSLSRRYSYLRKKLGIPKEYHFHSNRAYFASSAAAAGVPDTYTSQMGGWRRGSVVLKATYQRVQDEKMKGFQSRINKGLDGLLKKV